MGPHNEPHFAGAWMARCFDGQMVAAASVCELTSLHSHEIVHELRLSCMRYVVGVSAVGVSVA